MQAEEGTFSTLIYQYLGSFTAKIPDCSSSSMFCRCSDDSLSKTMPSANGSTLPCLSAFLHCPSQASLIPPPYTLWIVFVRWYLPPVVLPPWRLATFPFACEPSPRPHIPPMSSPLFPGPSMLQALLQCLLNKMLFQSTNATYRGLILCIFPLLHWWRRRDLM